LAASASYSSKQSNHGNFGTNFVVYGDNILISRASFTVSSERWSAMLYGDNLNNTNAGGPPAEPFPDLTPRPRPRTVGLQVDWKFQ
jgi:hypothetical protein